MSKTKTLIGYFIIWAAAVAIFWIWPDSSAMNYSVVMIYAGIPLLSLAAALATGLYDWFGGGKWLFLAVLGAMNMLFPFLTYDMSKALAAGAFPHVNLNVFIYGTVISLGGMLIGWGMARSREKKGL